jgi:radical SAM protein with 4Fe4S-binding SPASM domain
MHEFLKSATTGNSPPTPDIIDNTFGRLLPRPIGLINIDVSSRCNLKCVMCPLWSEQRTQSIHGGFMDFALFETLLGKVMRGAPKASISLTPRGELFCHPRAMDICRAVRKTQYPLSFITNATLLTDEIIRELFTLETREIRVSVDAATPETYTAVRGSDKLHRVFHAIQTLSRMNAERPPETRINVILNFVLQDLNAHEAEPFLQFWAPFVNRVAFLKWQTDVNSPLDSKAINKGFPAPARYPCISPWLHTYVDFEGNVYPCCADGFVTMDMGNLKEQPLKDIWLGEPYMELRRALLKGDFSQHPTCARCTNWNMSIRRNPIKQGGMNYLLTEDVYAFSLINEKPKSLVPMTMDGYIKRIGELMDASQHTGAGLNFVNNP